MNFTEAELAALDSDFHNIGVFFRLAVEPDPVRLWLGFGAIAAGVNVFDPSGAEYVGFGELKDIPEMTQLVNGTAERVDFTISGVSGSVLSIASGDDATAVKGKPVTVGFALLDSNYAMIGAVHWLAYYIADYLGGEQSPASASEQIVRTISLSCGTRMTGRRRPSYAYYSDADQQARFPGDKFCSIAPQYAHGFNKTWPVF